MYHTDTETEGHIGVGVEELASATAGQAFLDAELDADSNLTLEDFKRWYTDIPSMHRLGSIGQTRSEDAEYICMEEEAAVLSVEDLCAGQPASGTLGRRHTGYGGGGSRRRRVPEP